MAYSSSDGNPTRFLQGQTSDNRSLLLDTFGGEVLTAFHESLLMADKVQKRTLPKGSRSTRFPKVWKATAEYHVAGKEMLGNEIETGEISITIDEILVAHTAIYDLDDILTHFDVRAPFSKELGLALAKVYDKNVARQIVLAARHAADGPFPGGSVITDAALVNTGTINGVDWIDGIRAANKALFEKDVPDEQPRYLAVNWDVFEAIKWAKDASGNYLVLDRNFGVTNTAGGIQGRTEQIQIDNVTIFKTRNLPTTNESADATVYSKYRANYATTTGVLWTPMAVASATLMDVSLETERDVRRLEDFMVAKALAGHGTLRPECAVEFKTA